MSKILIVDDDAVVRSVAVRLMSQAGHQIQEAEDGVQAFDKYQDERPDVVLLDITMPRMDGLNTLVAIRRYDPKARVIMLTGLADQKIAMRAVKMGARDFVVKPFKVERLMLAVKRSLETVSA